jgi:hypothetical protein
MEWIKERVWQLGIAVVLALVGAWVTYTAGVGEGNWGLLWVGLALIFLAMAIPLVSRFLGSARGEAEDESEN